MKRKNPPVKEIDEGKEKHRETKSGGEGNWGGEGSWAHRRRCFLEVEVEVAGPSKSFSWLEIG